MNKEEYIKQWSEKLSSPIDVITEDYKTILEQEKQQHPALTPEEQEANSLRRLALSFKKQLRSPAVGFEGMVIAVSDCIDMIRKQRTESINLYKTNPQEAISKGITNEDGVPLVTRQFWPDNSPNRDYGKPLPEHSYMKTIIGIAVKVGSADSPKIFTMNIRGERAQSIIIPMFAPVRFRAIDKSQDDTSYTLNSSTFTTFEEDNKLQLPPPDKLISKHVAYSKISELNLYHEREKDNYNRLVVIEGDVSTLNLEPTSTGSRLMVIEDSDAMMDMESIETPGVTCWIPQHINIDFGEQSKVIVFGRTSQGTKRDEQGNPTNEPGDIMINTMGVYAIPHYKVNPDVVELTPENTRVAGEETPTKEEETW